jgi:hypothetical protein
LGDARPDRPGLTRLTVHAPVALVVTTADGDGDHLRERLKTWNRYAINRFTDSSEALVLGIDPFEAHV